MCRRCFEIFEQPSKLIAHQRERMIKCKPSSGIKITKEEDNLRIEYM